MTQSVKIGTPRWNQLMADSFRSELDHIEVICGRTHLVVPPGYAFVAQDGFGWWHAYRLEPVHFPHCKNWCLSGIGSNAIALRKSAPVKTWREQLYRLPRRAGHVPQHKVLLVYPYAYAYRWTDSWTIYSARPGYPIPSNTLGDGRTEALAWSSAAEQLSNTSASGSKS